METELREIATFACVSAGLSTTRSGGISSAPTLNAVLVCSENHTAHSR